jgi:alpha/beta superfamily hydrolase
MSSESDIERRTVEFPSADGIALVGDLAVPGDVRGGAVVCHPHPGYGGDRFNHVVTSLYEALPGAAITALRFDFRAAFGDGVGEQQDALGALDELTATVGDLPLTMVGYSFGAWIVASLTDERIAASVLVAPPLAVMPPVPVPRRPTLVLTPEHDQLSPPAANEPITASWTAAGDTIVEHHVIAMADHSLVGRTAAVASRTTTWLADHL